MRILILNITMFLISTNVFAYKHLKTSNYDLRTQTILLSILASDGSLHEIHKSARDEYFLYTKIKTDKVERMKISNITAEDYDKFFVSKFILIKYSLPPFLGKNCSKSYTLSMRGETQNICKGEDKKLVEMTALLKKLKKIYTK